MGKHEHRSINEDGSVTCECGEVVSSDELWLTTHTDFEPEPEPEPEIEPEIEPGPDLNS